MRGYVFCVSARLSCNNFPVNTVSFFMTGDNSTVYLYFPPPLGCHWTPGVVPCSSEERWRPGLEGSAHEAESHQTQLVWKT